MKSVNPKILDLANELDDRLAPRFREIEKIAEENTARVMDSFHDLRVSDSYFAGTSGYGYDDKGRQALDSVYAQVFGAESALVRTGFVNGTHAISAALFAATAPGDTLLSITGAPYDTLRETIGIENKRHGSLAFYGINYKEVSLNEDSCFDYNAIINHVKNPRVSTVFIQRSRGYSTRKALGVSQIGSIIQAIKSIKPSVNVLVDNCYGEFTETLEPTHVGADLIAGSLIKNPGGGLAPTGGYVAGKNELVLKAAARLTTTGIDGECGPTLGHSRLLFQGFFMAPHTVCQAIKTAVFASAMLEGLGYETSPGPFEPRYDIIQMISLKTPENLEKFCQGIQHASPVDSFVTPVPWQMPGYDCPVIMAAGAFIQGSSIELSADGPMREPYPAFLQGGLTYESGKIGIMSALSEMLD